MAKSADRVWTDSMPEAYEQYLVPAVFRPFALDLVARVNHLGHGRILEIAAGTGVLTRELALALPDAELTATDLNPAMVSFGSTKAPGARWEQADAAHLECADAQFDLVVCQFGVMFFPDKPAAFAEMARVLRPGGQVLFNTWGTVASHGFADALVAGLERAFPDDPPNFVVDVPHGYCSPELVRGDLDAGGLHCQSVETVKVLGNAGSAEEIAIGFCTGTPVRAAIESRGDLTSAVAIVSDEMTRRLGPGPVSCEMTAHVFQALR